MSICCDGPKNVVVCVCPAKVTVFVCLESLSVCFSGYLFLSLFCCFTSQVNSYGHGGKVSSPNHTFFLGKLEKAVNQYFVHILSKCGSRGGGGTGVPDPPPPPGKAQVIWVSIGNKQLDPPWKKLDPPPLENVGHPLEP